MTRTWMLFDTGTCQEVTCRFYDPLPDRTLSGFVINSPCRDFDDAAENAVHAVYAGLKARGFSFSSRQAAISLSSAESHPDPADSAGQSGGLAFAIAAARQFLSDQDPETASTLPAMAATGVIDDTGAVSRVRGIPAKLEAAAEAVKENGFIFYPKGNRPQLPPGLEETLEAENIRLCPVASLDQVFDILLGPPPNKTVNKKLLVMLLAAVLILAAAAGFFYLTPSATSPDPAPAKTDTGISPPEAGTEPEPAPAQEPPPPSAPEPEPVKTDRGFI